MERYYNDEESESYVTSRDYAILTPGWLNKIGYNLHKDKFCGRIFDGDSGCFKEGEFG